MGLAGGMEGLDVCMGGVVWVFGVGGGCVVCVWFRRGVRIGAAGGGRCGLGGGVVWVWLVVAVRGVDEVVGCGRWMGVLVLLSVDVGFCVFLVLVWVRFLC